jgi:hypothetical protein
MASGDPGDRESVNPRGEQPTTDQSRLGVHDPAPAIHDKETVLGDLQPSSGEASRAIGLAADLDEFKSVLVELGLIGSDELGAFAVGPPSGVLGLARALIRAGRLTSYQSAAIYQKKSRGLLIGRYLILDKLG